MEQEIDVSFSPTNKKSKGWSKTARDGFADFWSLPAARAPYQAIEQRARPTRSRRHAPVPASGLSQGTGKGKAPGQILSIPRPGLSRQDAGCSSQHRLRGSCPVPAPAPQGRQRKPSAFLPLTPRGVPRCPLSTSDSTAGLTQLKTLEAPLASPPTPLPPLLRAWIFPSAQRGKWVSIQK